jgi:hypothetical protein
MECKMFPSLNLYSPYLPTIKSFTSVYAKSLLRDKKKNKTVLSSLLSHRSR